MKKTYMLALAALIFVACNNNKGTKSETKSTTTTTDNNASSNRGNNTSGGKWDDTNQKAFLDKCVEGSTASMGSEKANSYCSCMLDKIQNQ